MLLAECGFTVRLEVAVPNLLLRPANLLVEDFTEAPHCSWMLLESIPCNRQLLLRESLPGVTRTRVAAKQVLYTGPYSIAGWRFAGLDFKTTGAWSASTTAFVRKWAQRLQMGRGAPTAQCFATLTSAISALFALAVGEQLITGMDRTRRPAPTFPYDPRNVTNEVPVIQKPSPFIT